MNLGALVATLGVNSAGLVKAQKDMLAFEKKTQASLTRINAKLVTTGAAMKKVGKSMTMYLTLPMALVGGAAVKMSMDFESSMSKIVGLVGIAREQVDKWGQDIIKMAPQLGKAPKELADALFFITSAGIRGAEAMDVLRMSAKASISGLGETKVVADLVTSAMNAYGKETLNATMATDVLTASVREGKAEATALATTMGMVLPIASNMGVQFHEVGAAVAAMTRTGTNAATASMQLRQILASLLKPTSQAEEALYNMNTSAANLRKTIKQDGLLAALMEIRKLTAQYGETVMSDVFPNIRALSGALDIMGANLEDNKAIFASLAEAAGSSAKAFGAAAETFEFKWNQATASVKTGLTMFGKTIAEEIIPMLVRFGDGIRKATMWFRGLDDAQKQTVVRIGALIMILGPVIKILGFLIGNVLPRLISVGYGVVKMFGVLKIAMMTNPFTVLIGAVGLLAMALIGLRSKAMKAKEEQKKLNEELNETNNIANAANYKEVLRQLDLLIIKRMELGKGAFIEVETINTSKKALTELMQKIGQLPIEYLQGAKQLITAEIIEVKRSMSHLVTTGDEFLDLVTVSEKQQELQALSNALKAITKELKAVSKIKITSDAGTGAGVAPIPLETQMQTKPFWLTDTSNLVSMQNEQLSLAQQMADDLVDIEKETQERLKAIRQVYDKEKMDKVAEYLNLVGNMLSSIGNLWRVQKEKELSMVGDNAKKREQIEKKFALREKAIAIGLAMINTALAITKVLGQTGVLSPFVIPLIAAAGAIQIAAIAAQKFAAGGAVSGPTLAMVGEAPNISRSNPEFIGTAAQLGLDKLGGQSGSQKVIFEIEGTTLKGVLSNIERQTNSYS